MIKIAVDAMGGDFAPQAQVEGAMLAVKRNPDIEITLFGQKEEIEKYLTSSERILIEDCREVIPMGETDPMHAIRSMKDSSMVRMLRAVTDGTCDACCSSGPTQGLVVGALLIVKRMPGFKRFALAPVIPSMTTGQTIVLDCGANLEVKPQHLVQQAYFAKIYAEEVLGRENPKIGLLNIGVEEGKGRDIDKEYFKALRESNLNFIGNVEPSSILEPPCDILIGDGFTVDMVVKTMEGTAKSMGKMLKSNLKKGFFGKIGALLSMKNLNRFKKQINPDEVAGAMIYGINRPVVKAHGSSNAYAFSFGIQIAVDSIRKQVIEKVREALEQNPIEEASDE